VSLAHRLRFAHPGQLQVVQAVLAQGLQQLEPLPSAGLLQAADQAAVQQRAQRVQDLVRVELSVGADRLGRRQRPATGEDGQAPEQHLLGWLEQVVTPGQRLA
jgi:hypothetical protein